jgi:hypothetical protein
MRKSGNRKPTKAGGLIVNVTGLLIVPQAPLYVACRVTAYVLAVVGVPEITPVFVSTVRPGGKFNAPKLRTLPVATI